MDDSCRRLLSGRTLHLESSDVTAVPNRQFRAHDCRHEDQSLIRRQASRAPHQGRLKIVMSGS